MPSKISQLKPPKKVTAKKTAPVKAKAKPQEPVVVEVAYESPKIARFEKLDPKKQRFFFDEKRVYANGTESSFEELRAVAYWKKKTKEDEIVRRKRLEDEVVWLRSQLAELQKHVIKNATKDSTNVSSPIPTVSSRKPLTEINDKKGRSKGRNIDNIVVAASVSGEKTPFEIYEDASSEVVVRPPKAKFEIFTDQTGELTKSSEATSIEPIKPKGNFQIYCEESEQDLQKAIHDITRRISLINPLAGMLESRQSIGSTFLLPPEEEFFSRALTASTPNNKKRSMARTGPNEVTGKLETICETSREYKSSSSGSSGAHTTGRTGIVGNRGSSVYF